jgi:serine/threonine-protein kinase
MTDGGGGRERRERDAIGVAQTVRHADDVPDAAPDAATDAATDETLSAESTPDRARTVSSRTRLALAAGGSASDESSRFELLGVLGTGGMGEVHLAYDVVLRRHVALKVLFGTSPDQAARLLLEAQAQARVEHPHVCRVYGVGELGGHPYIALQLVRDGRTLKEVGPTLPLEERVRVMKLVAEALHAAHREGLVHRDVKPANVLMERGDDGRYVPYVADFGIARDAEATQTMGAGASGTPLYMAPEQVRAGAGRRVDRRTDVYGLGATLYELLVGRPPFPGGSAAQVILRVLDEQVTPPRAIDPTVPRDLATIVLQCLEKDPSRRYETARALAEDLGRWLDGEPVRARRASRAYRLSVWAKKHRRALGIVGAAAVAVGVVGAVAIDARRGAARRARAGQLFGQKVERIDAIRRMAALLPLHDTRRERALIRTRMQEIRDELGRLGPEAQAAGQYALGRGHQALGELVEAERALRAAWDGGAREPEVALALGAVLGARYEEALDEAEHTSDAALRASRRKRAREALRDPALALLRQGERADLEAPEYVAGLIALYDKRYEEAAERARQALGRAPWLYEAHVLVGDARFEYARLREDDGDQRGARAAYAEAGEAYRAALALAPSAPEAHRGECRRLVRGLELAVDTSEGVAEAARQAVAACGRAVLVDPESSRAACSLGDVHWHEGRGAALRGEDPRPLFAQALRAAQVEGVRAAACASFVEARARLGEADWQVERGEDPRPALAAALQAIDRAEAAGGDRAMAVGLRAHALTTTGGYEAGRGVDPEPSLRRAITEGERAVAMEPIAFNVRTVMAEALYTLVAWQVAHGRDPRADVTRGLAVADELERLQPQLDYGPVNGCAILGAAARYALESGGDPTSLVERALARCDAAAARDAGFMGTPENRGRALLVRARYERAAGRSPEAALAEARRALAAATAGEGATAAAWAALGEAARLEARWARERHRSTAAALAEAARADGKARELGPRDAGVYAGAAETERLRAEELVAGKRPADEPLRRALASVERALVLDPQHPRALAERAAVYLVGARAETSAEAREAARRRARAGFDEALRLNPLLKFDYAPLIEEAR